MPTTLVWMNAPGSVIDRSTCDSAAEMQDMADRVSFHNSANGARIPEIHPLEPILGIVRHHDQVFKVSGIRQAIQVHQKTHLGLPNDVADQIGADETGTPSNQQVHNRIDGLDHARDTRLWPVTTQTICGDGMDELPLFSPLT